MHVVGHEDIGVYVAASTRSRFGQAFEIKPPIRVAKEACGTVVPALTHMVRYTGQFEAGRPGHACLTHVSAEGFASAGFVTGKLL
jgi:hypothetical protein